MGDSKKKLAWSENLNFNIKYSISISDDVNEAPSSLFCKVHIFWEGHKILRNLYLNFVLFSASQKWGGDFVAFSEYMYIWTLTFYFLKIFSNFRTMCYNAGRFARLVVTRQKLPAAKANYWPYNMFTPQFWQGRGTLRARWSTCIGCLIFMRNDIKCQKICGFMLFVICMCSWFL